MRNKIFFVLLLALTAVSVFPLGAAAETANIGNPVTAPLTNPGYKIGSVNSTLELLRTILKWIATVFWIFAVGYIFYAAYLFLFASHSKDGHQKGKTALIYAVIAIIIGLMAYGLPFLVDQFLKGQ